MGPSALESTVGIEVAFVEVHFQPLFQFNFLSQECNRTRTLHKPVEIEIMKKISACIVAREDKTLLPVAKRRANSILMSVRVEIG